MTIKEVSPATVDKAQELANILEQAQILANKLVVNDELGELKLDDQDINYLIMRIKHKVLSYQQDVQDAMAHTF